VSTMAPRVADPGAAIVVGVDDQPGCADAVRWAADEAATRGVALWLVHAWSWGVCNPDLPRVEATVRADVVTRIEPLFAQFSALAAGRGALVAKADVTEGYPPNVLAAASNHLVVVGSHHLHGVDRAVMGSTSGALASRAGVPVVVVNGAPAAPDAGVVVGLSGGPDDARLMDFAFDYADRHHVPLQTVLCWDPPLGDHRLPPPRRLQAWADQFVGEWIERYPAVSARATVVRAHPIETLVGVSRDQALLVVGRRRRRTHFGGIFGSTSLGVLRHAACAVAILPPAWVPAQQYDARSTDRAKPGRVQEDTMNDIITIELTPAELQLAKNALRSFLSDFGHDEADTIKAIRALMAKLPAEALTTAR